MAFRLEPWPLEALQADNPLSFVDETPKATPNKLENFETYQTEMIPINTVTDEKEELSKGQRIIHITSSGLHQTPATGFDHNDADKDSTSVLDDQVDPKPSAFERAWFLNRLHYFYAVMAVFKTRKKGPGRNLQLEDFPLLGRTEEVGYKTLEFEQAYERHKKKYGKPSLFWPIVRVFWLLCLKEQLWTFGSNATKLTFTYLLSQVLEYVAVGDKTEAYKWAGGLFATVIFGVYSFHYSFYQSVKILGHLKPALIGIIYKKINRLSYFSINQVSIGKIVNIAANDLNYFEFNIYFAFYVMASPMILGAALGLLWSFFGVACLPGIGCLLLMWPVQYLLSKLTGSYMKEKNLVTDERIKLTNELIEGIRLLKMYAWDTQFSKMIEKSRNREVTLLKRIGYTELFSGHLFSRIPPVLGSFLIFVTYSLQGNTLTTGRVYATIIVMSFLRVAAVFFSNMAFKFIIEARLIFQRIIQLLEIPETNEIKVAEPINPVNGVEFSDFSAYWGEKRRNTSENKKSAQITIDELTFDNPTLKHITFSVKKGTLCALVGKIGCGKSTTLMSFFNEVPKTTGELRYSGRLAYVEQEIVIYPGTVRSNILFGRPYDEEKYKRITEACCLLDDFREFPNGDLTEIGERGVNLSGGQKARTSLARALYSDADVYLLDDPLSAVDTKVAKNLFNNAIRGVLKDKTVILATHQVHFAREAEKIVVLENGALKAEGTLDDIIRQDSSILAIFEAKQRRKTSDNNEIQHVEPEANGKISKLQETEEQKQLENLFEEQEAEEEVLNEEQKARQAKEKEEKGTLVQKEKDESAEVGWSTYRFYLKHLGNWFLVLIFVLDMAAIEVLAVLYTRFLGYWTQGVWSPELSMKVLGGIIGGFILCLCVREVFFVNFSMKISATLHKTIFHRILRAAVEFYDTNPAGRILNRFSNDVGVLDRYLLQVSNDLMDAAFYFSSLFITVWVVFPWLLIPGFFLILFYFLLMRFVKRVIIQSRGVELLTRSPIYSLFSTTLFGLISIRIYGQGKRFVREFIHLLNRNIRAFHLYYDATRVFGFYSDYFAALFACIGIAIILAFDIDPGLLGLVCTSLLSMTDFIQWAMRQILMHIMQMASTARVQAYTQIQQEAELTLPNDKELIKEQWPAKGEVEFHNVHMKYRKNMDHVLKGLTFSVKGGEKIGCVGRTGAGKSSIIQALFRMVEIDKESVPDSYIKIDETDTQQIGLHLIRKNISIIPQTPFIFMGSVKRNLDPLQEYSEQQIIEALTETGLWDYIKALPNGLDTDMSNASSVFSVGQKQLICLARTILQNNKILVLDEATANIDFETDNFIQKKIMERFKHATIFTIAHRLSTVANYDKVLVMDKGRVIEFDHPYRLLAKNVGDRSITNLEGVFASMVMNTGSKHAYVIFEIARKSYFHSKRTEEQAER